MYCKSNNIKNIEDYNTVKNINSRLTTMPNYFYIGFNNIQYELQLLDNKRRK